MCALEWLIRPFPPYEIRKLSDAVDPKAAVRTYTGLGVTAALHPNPNLLMPANTV